MLAGCSAGTGHDYPLPTPNTPSVSVAADSACHLGPSNRPDPTCTPGATNPDVTQATISKTICVVGWTGTIRPPTSYTSPLKTAAIVAYGYTDTRPESYEYDHLIPLELGGAPSDLKNLWPELHEQATHKDVAENVLHTQVCAGITTLDAARTKILADWGPALPSQSPAPPSQSPSMPAPATQRPVG